MQCRYDELNETLEIYLGGSLDDKDSNSLGYSSFALQLTLEGTTITAIDRIGHIHMCGQGADHVLRVFPRRCLETEAEKDLSCLVVSAKTAERQQQKLFEKEMEERAERKRKRAERKKRAENGQQKKRKIRRSPTYPWDSNPRTFLGKIRQAVMKGKADGDDGVLALIDDSLRNNTSPQDIYEKGLMRARKDMLQAYAKNEAYLPEIIMMQRALDNGLDVLSETGFEPKQEYASTLVLAATYGGVSDMTGKILSGLLKHDGITTVLASSCSASRIQETMNDSAYGVILLWNSPCGSRWTCESTLGELRNAGCIRPILIGGWNVKQTDAKKWKADGFFSDPLSAAKLIKKLTKQNRAGKHK